MDLRYFSFFLYVFLQFLLFRFVTIRKIFSIEKKLSRELESTVHRHGTHYNNPLPGWPTRLAGQYWWGTAAAL